MKTRKVIYFDINKLLGLLLAIPCVPMMFIGLFRSHWDIVLAVTGAVYFLLSMYLGFSQTKFEKFGYVEEEPVEDSSHRPQA